MSLELKLTAHLETPYEPAHFVSHAKFTCGFAALSAILNQRIPQSSLTSYPAVPFELELLAAKFQIHLAQLNTRSIALTELSPGVAYLVLSYRLVNSVMVAHWWVFTIDSSHMTVSDGTNMTLEVYPFHDIPQKYTADLLMLYAAQPMSTFDFY